MKYLIYEDSNGFHDVYWFPATMGHASADALFSQGRKYVSAGKVRLGSFGSGDFIDCIPGSVQLDFKWSADRQAQDHFILKQQFNTV